MIWWRQGISIDQSCLTQEADEGIAVSNYKNVCHLSLFSDQPEVTAQIIMQFIYSRG